MDPPGAGSAAEAAARRSASRLRTPYQPGAGGAWEAAPRAAQAVVPSDPGPLWGGAPPWPGGPGPAAAGPGGRGAAEADAGGAGPADQAPLPVLGVAGAFLASCSGYLGLGLEQGALPGGPAPAPAPARAQAPPSAWAGGSGGPGEAPRAPRTPAGSRLGAPDLVRLWPRIGAARSRSGSAAPARRGAAPEDPEDLDLGDLGAPGPASLTLGDAILKSTLITDVLESTSNNARTVLDYAIDIVDSAAALDNAWHAEGAYGFDYVAGAMRSSWPAPGAGGAGLGSPQGSRPATGPGPALAVERGPRRSSSRRRGPSARSPASRGPPGRGRGPWAPGAFGPRDAMKGADYICQVVSRENYSLETQFLACGLFHRFCSFAGYSRADVKLLAGVSLFVATKYEENYGDALGNSAIRACFADAFGPRELLDAELRCLDSIDWRIGVSAVNARLYLRPLFRDLGLGRRVTLLATYLTELSLMSPEFTLYHGFEVALAAVELAVLGLASRPGGAGPGLPGAALSTRPSLVEQMVLAITAGGVEREARAPPRGPGRQAPAYAQLQRRAEAAGGAAGPRERRDPGRPGSCREALLQAWRESYSGPRTTQIFLKYSSPSYFRVASEVEPVASVQAALDAAVRSLGGGA